MEPDIEKFRCEDSVSNEDKENESNVTRKTKGEMIYTIEDVPPWYMCIILGLQVMAL